MTLCLSAFFRKLAGGFLINFEISLLCVECRLQETLIGQASAGSQLQQICKSFSQEGTQIDNNVFISGPHSTYLQRTRVVHYCSILHDKVLNGLALLYCSIQRGNVKQ